MTLTVPHRRRRRREPSPAPSPGARSLPGADAPRPRGTRGGDRRRRLRQQRAPRLPGQPRLLPERRGLAGRGRRPHLDPAPRARGPADVPDPDPAAERSRSSPSCCSPGCSWGSGSGPGGSGGEAAAVPRHLRRGGRPRRASARTSTSSRASARTRPRRRRRRSSRFDKTKVEGLALSAPGQEDVELVREKDGWRMTAPMAVAADAAEVERAARPASRPSRWTRWSRRRRRTWPSTGSPRRAPRCASASRARAAPLVLQVGDKTPGRQRGLRPRADRRRACSPSPPTSRRRSRRSPSTCATAAFSTCSATR